MTVRWLVGGFILILVVLTAFGGPGAGASAERTLPPYLPPRGYVCHETAKPLRIDGQLDEAAWQTAPWTADFVDIEGEAKPKPRFRTRAKMLWDNEFFYIAAKLEEPHVWATLTEHDSYIFQEDNDFEVFIDPDGDNHAYAEFEINALNTGWDLLLTMPYRDGGLALDAWDIPGLRTAVQVDGTLNDARDSDKSWTLEMAFPWKVLGRLAPRCKTPPLDGEQWRVNFSRVEWQHEVVNGKYRRVPKTSEDNWVWSPQGVVNMHQPETWGYVQFSTAPLGQAKFQPDPAGPTRHLLRQVYNAQHAYRKDHKRWARSLSDLQLPDLMDSAVSLSVTDSLFEASAPVRLTDGSTQNWRVRQDSRTWKD